MSTALANPERLTQRQQLAIAMKISKSGAHDAPTSTGRALCRALCRSTHLYRYILFIGSLKTWFVTERSVASSCRAFIGVTPPPAYIVYWIAPLPVLLSLTRAHPCCLFLFSNSCAPAAYPLARSLVSSLRSFLPSLALWPRCLSLALMMRPLLCLARSPSRALQLAFLQGSFVGLVVGLFCRALCRALFVVWDVCAASLMTRPPLRRIHQTLHPTYTLHPTPYTSNPAPCTLYPTSYTLQPNLTPYTRDPTPYILHPAT
jgi:hypothetical protein